MNDDARMQAIVFDDFGGPEVLVARDVARKSGPMTFWCAMPPSA